MTSFFSHDSNARNDEKIVQLRMEHGAAGYGVYFMLLERLRDSSDYMSVKDYNMLAFDLRVSSGLVKSVIEDFGLFAFTDKGERFYSESFMRRMAIKDKETEAKSRAGKKGAAKRWGTRKTGVEMAKPSQNNSRAITEPSKKIASKVKESKVKESKVSKVNSSGSSARGREIKKINEQSQSEELEKNSIWLTYVENINPLPSATEFESMTDWLDNGIEEAMIILAIKEAAIANKRSWKYINAILRNCHRDGIKTAAQFEARQKQWEREKKSSKSKSTKTTGRANFKGRENADYAGLTSYGWMKTREKKEVKDD